MSYFRAFFVGTMVFYARILTEEPMIRNSTFRQTEIIKTTFLQFRLKYIQTNNAKGHKKTGQNCFF